MNKQKLRELAEKATPGDWFVGECYADNGQGTYCGIYNSVGRDVYSEDGISEPDAEYIAAANSATILALLDENAALLEALRDLRDFYEELTNLPACKANSAIAKAESS